MPRFGPTLLLGALLAALALPAAASAAFFPGELVDGPSPDIASVGGVDLARDGTGALVYVKSDGGVAHIFASRLVAGVWQPPERLDPGLAGASSAPVVAVADQGRTVVAFVNGGQLYTILRRPADTAWPAPVAIAGSAATPSIDLSVNGVGYVVWSSSGDVRAATLARTATTWSPLDAPLDIDPAADAGSGLGRPQVAASADGTALVAWGESGHVFARRLFHTRQSTIPQQLDVPTLSGHTGGVADTPKVDIADDSSFAWVVFREAFDNGASTQVLARKLIGSAFDPPLAVGSGFAGEGSDAPAVDIAGSGDGVFAADSTATHTPFGAQLYIDVFHPAAPLGTGNAISSNPQVAVGENDQTSLAWLTAPTAAGPVVVHARGFKKAKPTDAETPLSDPAVGSVDPAGGFFAAADHYGDAVFGFVQVTAAGRQLMVARWDRPPAYLAQTTTSRWRRPLPVGWTALSDVWGPITYTVFVDGRAIGSTVKASLPVAGVVRDGVHRWRVVAVDPRGQRSATITRPLRLDGTPPRLHVRVSGSLTAGSTLDIRARAADRRSGVGHVKVNFGDGSPAVIGTDVHHAFAAGRYTVTVTATDVAGNAAVVTRVITVR